MEYGRLQNLSLDILFQNRYILRKNVVKKSIKYIVVTLLVIATIIALAGMYKFNYLSGLEGYDCDGNKITTNRK